MSPAAGGSKNVDSVGSESGRLPGLLRPRGSKQGNWGKTGQLKHARARARARVQEGCHLGSARFRWGAESTKKKIHAGPPPKQKRDAGKAACVGRHCYDPVSTKPCLREKGPRQKNLPRLSFTRNARFPGHPVCAHAHSGASAQPTIADGSAAYGVEDAEGHQREGRKLQATPLQRCATASH